MILAKTIDWKSVIPNFREGDVITPFKTMYREYASVKRQDTKKVGVYNELGKLIVPEEFDECINSIMLLVQKGELYGVYNFKGIMIVPVQFDRIYFGDFWITVENQNGLWGAYNYNGYKILDCQFETIRVLEMRDNEQGRAIIGKDNLYGVLSENGSEVIPRNFNHIYSIDPSRYGFEVYTSDATGRSLIGYYDWDGNVIVPCKFKKCNIKYISNVNFTEYRVETYEGLIGIYSKEGKVVVPPKYTQIEYFFKYAIATAGEDTISIYTLDGECLFSR